MTSLRKICLNELASLLPCTNLPWCHTSWLKMTHIPASGSMLTVTASFMSSSLRKRSSFCG
eukprot:CAMPEP_0197056320 /NCGR_PEP_ID=MMETSP1384-20130603/82399_1 /TAXON_ID=29189 /ORGANISM="Ammonia sp." /LENGTH=60 /DNA_ID=CAMNT_0042490247 /DNA_START=23 /DNA_END=201 /DNA_ORIENTATION=+